MTKYIFGLLFLLLAAILQPTPAAYAASTVEVGKYQIEYDQYYKDDTDDNGSLDCTSYYLGDKLVFTAWDTDENGVPDLWFRYDGEEYLDLELADDNGDGKPDEIAMVDRDENVNYLEASSFDIWELLGSSAIAIIGVIAITLIFLLVKKGRFMVKGGPGNDKHL